MALTDAARLIGAYPGIGRPQPTLVGERYRIWSLANFPYLLIYDPVRRPPQVLRIVHGARDLPPLLAELGE
jgi:toxin ParE1/3/4